MPAIDFGSVTLYVDEGRVDVFFPKEHGELKQLMKSMNARWNGERWCWVVTCRFAKKSEEEVVDAVERALLSSAPSKWPAAVERFGAFACATKNYEIKFGSGGLRLTFPEGHPCHWKLEKLPGAGRKPRGKTWTIPARSADTAVVIPILERAAKEDRAKFFEAVEPYEGRTLRGTLPISVQEADRIGIVEGSIVFAEFSFVKVADPQIVNMPVHAWPFHVIQRKDEPGEGDEDLDEGVYLRLEYPEAGKAFKAVRSMMALPDEERPVRLDGPHARGKWHARSRR